jgi:hypothetical protein
MLRQEDWRISTCTLQIGYEETGRGTEAGYDPGYIRHKRVAVRGGPGAILGVFGMFNQ